MMRLLSSAPALALASAAALSLTATPAMARHWHRDRGIDAGDVLAGVLIIGGIAAVASAASKSNRTSDARDYRYPDRHPESRNPESRYPSDSDYRDWRAERDSESGYAQDREDDRYGSGDWRGGDAIDGAVSACTGEIERGNRQIDTVEGVNRASDGWRVDGRLSDGRAFSCTTGADGRIRSATVDGRAVI